MYQRPRACIHIQRNKDNMACCKLNHVRGPCIKTGRMLIAWAHDDGGVGHPDSQ